MDLTLDSNLYIEPRSRDAAAIGAMLKRQGDMRGFLLDTDNTLVIFDSYGNTHNSVRLKLGLRNEFISLIFRLNGSIWVDCSLGNKSKAKLEAMFNESHCRFFRAMYRAIGIAEEKVHITIDD